MRSGVRRQRTAFGRTCCFRSVERRPSPGGEGVVCSNLTTLTPLRCTAWFVRAVGAAVRPDHASGEPHDRIIQAEAEQQSTAQAQALAFEQPFALDRPSVFTSARPNKLVGWQSTTILQPLRLTEQLRVPSIDRANRRFSQRPIRVSSSDRASTVQSPANGGRHRAAKGWYVQI